MAGVASRGAGLLVAALAVAVAACGAAIPPPASQGASPPASLDAASPLPSPTDLTVASTSPSPGGTPEPGVTPAASPVATSASPTPILPPTPGPAAGCTGSEDNRDFYAAVAEAVDWAVYCPVLPTGWFVDSGSYRLADGGTMHIVYRGPASGRFELHEGAFCQDADGCVPDGTATGAATLGDRDGILVAADDGSWALVVDRGKAISWLALGGGIGEAAFREHAAAALVVGR